jgi:hypothetical protein
LEAAQIWRELAPYYFLAECFGGSSDFAGTGTTLFSSRLFWRQLRFGGNWLHIHYFPAYCFGGSSDLAGTGTTLLFLEAAQIWQELAPPTIIHYFLLAKKCLDIFEKQS